MPINLQGSGPISEGWGPAPKLDAPNIGTLVGEILRNKLLRDKMTQTSIADTIKNLQTQRQGDAYAAALRNTGLSEGQDFSGLSGPDMTRMAQLLEARTPDTQMDEYHKAMTELARARAGDINDPDPGTDTLDPAEQRRQNAEKRREEDDRLKAVQSQMKLSQLPSDAVPHALAPGEKVTPGSYPFDVGGKRQDIPQNRVDQFNTARRVYDVLTKQRAGIPSTTPQASGGADTNVAPDYRKQVSDADVQALSWARAHPDDPRSAAILRKLGVE